MESEPIDPVTPETVLLTIQITSRHAIKSREPSTVKYQREIRDKAIESIRVLLEAGESLMDAQERIYTLEDREDDGQFDGEQLRDVLYREHEKIFNRLGIVLAGNSLNATIVEGGEHAQ